jgi:hypothetical protein
MIDILVWGLVAILFMIMVFFFGIVIYYQVQILKLHNISKQIKLLNNQLLSIKNQLKEIKLE